ncbi:MAG: hypothetical protein ACFFDN_28840 [Candidatus Hodarchaeota archaeon]
MSAFLKEFKFDRSPLKIKYFDKETLKLNNEFIFFHNKSKFRKELLRLQYLIKSYTKSPLQASGIRDSFLKEVYSEKYFILLFTTADISNNTNQIIDKHSELEINQSCFYLEADTDYMLLLARDMDGLKLGINTMETILKQILEDYMEYKRFDEYIQICPFELMDCAKSL